MSLQTLESPALSADDRRRSERHPYVIDAWVRPPAEAPSEEPLEVISLEMSRHQIKLQLDSPLTPGGFYMIEIGLGSQWLVAEMRVVSCNWQDDGNAAYHVGAVFC